jgi:hypothetical protein
LAPHSRSSVDEISRLIGGQNADDDLLRELLAELGTRGGDAARRLADQVRRELAARAADPAGSGLGGFATDLGAEADRAGRAGEQAEADLFPAASELLRQKELVDLRRRLEITEARRAGIERERDNARRFIAKLQEALARKSWIEGENRRTRGRAEAAGSSLFDQVHLASNAPEWVVLAVRTAFRVRYHPDKQEGAEKKLRAEHKFKLAENVFSQILGRKA